MNRIDAPKTRRKGFDACWPCFAAVPGGRGKADRTGAERPSMDEVISTEPQGFYVDRDPARLNDAITVEGENPQMTRDIKA
ncbi:MAG: hypothetical protein VYD64_10645 [Pseudomonadota bacterium]|nr:hypothetical protein [Pseudomonadota bacterium]